MVKMINVVLYIFCHNFLSEKTNNDCRGEVQTAVGQGEEELSEQRVERDQAEWLVPHRSP